MKLSKSDTINKTQEAKDREWLNSLKPSEHFSVGSRVIIAQNKRGTVLAVLVSSDETLLRVKWDDDSISNIKPIALNRSTT
jgi:hypothetical protein